MLKIAILATSIFVTSVGFAQEMVPTYTEVLQNPIKLNCGVTIVENFEPDNSKKELSKQDIVILNTVCDKVLLHYKGFILSRQIGIVLSTDSFSWKASLLPDTSNPRCLNDINGRFKSRVIAEGNVAVDGYTDKNIRYSFSTSNRKSRFFKTVFAHEIFHALNIFYNISDTELDAEDFTEQLGYGR
jgi:hypothetical protein